MPRIYDSASNPVDYCRRCFPKTEKVAQALHGIESGAGEGPDERGDCFDFNADHPDYDSWQYACDECGKRLNRADD